MNRQRTCGQQRAVNAWAREIISTDDIFDQTRGTEWEYRIIAVNKADEGVPSNTVMAVL